MVSDAAEPADTGSAGRGARLLARLPPASFFGVSAVFHYSGRRWRCCCSPTSTCSGWPGCGSPAPPSCSPGGAGWRRPWRLLGRLTASQRWVLLGLGVVLAAMNTLFYLAVDRLPLSTVGAIEFLGTVVLAAAGARSRRNLAALVLAVGGVAALTDVRLAGHPLGFVFANCGLFMAYVILGHRIATTGPDGTTGDPRTHPMSGIDQLGTPC